MRWLRGHVAVELGVLILSAGALAGDKAPEMCLPDDLESTRLAFGHGGDGIEVLSGTGKRILRLGPSRKSKTRRVDPTDDRLGEMPKGGTSYFAPEVAPDQRRLVSNARGFFGCLDQHRTVF
jgi:hypothetical protein